MTEQDDILISRHLAGELDAEERTEFTRRLGIEPTFAAAVTEREQERDFLLAEDRRKALRERLQTLNSQYFSPTDEGARTQVQRQMYPAGSGVQGEGIKEQGELKSPSTTPSKTKTRPARILGLPRPLFTGLAVAATVAVVLLAWNPFGPNRDFRYYTDYAPLALTEKSSEATAEALAAGAAETAFNAGDYSAAYAALQDYLALAPDDSRARLALGIAALETDRDAEAQEILRTLAARPTLLQETAKFYLALAYVKADDPRARPLLEEIGTDHPEYGVRIARLLQWVE